MTGPRLPDAWRACGFLGSTDGLANPLVADSIPGDAWTTRRPSDVFGWRDPRQPSSSEVLGFYLAGVGVEALSIEANSSSLSSSVSACEFCRT